MITFFTRQIMVLLFILLMYIKQSYTETSCGLREVNHPDCVTIFECPALFQHLQKPLNSETRTILQRSQCGFEENTPKVCCPPNEQKNLHLLPQVGCGEYQVFNLFDGEHAELNEFPWMALLSYKIGNRTTFGCSGSLISNKYVLTANRCLGKSLYGVRIGEHEIGRKKDCVTYLDTVHCSDDIQDFIIEKQISHENYIKESSSNDIALLRLVGTANMARGNAKPICLPISTQMKQLNLTNLNMIVAGWGTTETKFRSNVLLKAIVPVVSSENCNTIRKYLTPNKLCAGELGKDSCKGDSGGPLISLQMNERQLTYVQFGIVSYGTGECGGKKHGIYTRVTEYMDWILNNLEP